MKKLRVSKPALRGSTLGVFSLHVLMVTLGVVPIGPALAGERNTAAGPGKTMDAVPFGEMRTWDADGKDYGVLWEDSRDIFRVVVTFADPQNLPDPDNLRIEYWQSSWPQNRIPRDRPSGSGGSGWLNVGDWHLGKWQIADAELKTEGPVCTFTFNPLNRKEFPRIRNFPAEHRTTTKLRVTADRPLPKISSFEAYTDSVWEEQEFEVEWGHTARNPQKWDGWLEVFNGHIRSIGRLEALAAGRLSRDNSWTSTVHNKVDGISAKILYAKTDAYNSFDQTVVTVRTEAATFSFAAADLIKHGHIFLPDFGVIVRKGGRSTTYEAAEKTWKEDRQKNIYTRVGDVPEQTLRNAWKDIPQKGRFYIPLGFDGGRQYFGLDPDGSVYCRYNWLSRIPGKDTPRVLYDGDFIRYSFGLNAADVQDRRPLDGCLPIMVTTWRRDGVEYRQTAFVIRFDGVPAPGGAIFADDTLIFMARIEMQALGDSEREATLDVRVTAAKPEQLAVHKRCIYVKDTKPPRLRMLFALPDLRSGDSVEAQDTRVLYRARLRPQWPTRVLDVAVPYITLTEQADWAKLQKVKFDTAFEAVRNYWRKRVEQGTQIVTPEPMINDYYKAHVSHLLLNTDREVGEAERYVARVGTFSYGAFSNESCMMVSDLDRRGYHKRAEGALETWLHYQGTVGLPGDFSTKDGQFYGARGYEAGGYNQHHGFVLWGLGEHYFYTRDIDWLRRAAPKIVKGCDWIINERKHNLARIAGSQIRAIEKGLLPQGNLEDIRDWRSWLSTNVYSWWGMDTAARALADAGLPDGPRLLREAEAYRKDILAAWTEAMQRSPVVRLRDGSWIPHIPPDVHRRGLTFGWITETLEGAIHMIRTGLLEPDDRISTWIIKDFEDNLYLSEQYGYNITGEQYEKYWFSRGGISQQANLLCNPIPYLLRDEPKHFLRAYFNAFAVSYFADTRMMTEHALPNIGDHRGDHYKSSDEANSTFWLRLMFVREQGDDLYLGAAIPRYWLKDGESCSITDARTYFGLMSLSFESHAAAGRIAATLQPPKRNPPKKIYLRFRHPENKRITRCTVNGKPHNNFDPEREWIVLDKAPDTTTEVVAHYE